MEDTSVHYSVDAYPVTVGAKFWNNDLRVVTITKVAAWDNKYSDTGEVQTWHNTDKGSFDTLSGTMMPYGRLVRFYGSRNAELFPSGTDYSSVK